MIHSKLKILYSYLEKCLEEKWLVKSFFICLLSIIIFSFPDFENLASTIKDYEVYKILESQEKDPLSQLYYDGESHYSKRQFRLTMPIIARFFGLTNMGLITLQYIFGLCLILMFLVLCYRITKDKVSSFFFTIAITFTYFGKACFVDNLAFFDGTAYFLLVLAIYINNPFMVFLCVFATCFTDERGAVASLMLVGWFQLKNQENTNNNKFFIPNQYSLAVLLSLFTYLACRCYLVFGLGLYSGKSGIGIGWSVYHYWDRIPIYTFLFLESFWCIPLISFLLLLMCKDYRKIIVLYIPFALSFFVAISVGDMIRSGAYLFVSIFSFLSLLSKYESIYTLKILALVICFFALLIPTCYNLGVDVRWIYPGWIKLIN